MPGIANLPLPYSQTTVNVNGTDCQAITYQRNPTAMQHMDQAIHRSSDLGITDAWDEIETVVVSITDLPNGMQEVIGRSTVAFDGQNSEFLRVVFTKK
ncbi:hypothetical protein HW115_02460 [Verrucomicrobiaceae bacterium N1E253]|uniref:Uncharacterized protein n=1 Tax=Oceaniferula marina TaxID=2748318 RepID=A0A851GAM3_9BACT|nr:hypothetical protein [Oceaniferula marina]NWK54456.1 hypothetical protein [Oceaniferula marina]